MRIRRSPVAPSLALALVVVGCDGGDGTRTIETPPPADLGAATIDPPNGNMVTDGFIGTLPDGDIFVPPPAGDMTSSPPVVHAPPGTLDGVVVLGPGTDFRDVSTDQGGGVWAAASGAAYYWPHGHGGPRTYNQGAGLAHGMSTWNDDYWCIGSTPCPITNPVIFTAVAGGLPGQAIIGNIGYIADKLQVDPTTGAVQSVEGFAVTSDQQPDPTELVEQRRRIVATWRGIVDLNGPFNGTAYIGGFHGTSAIHALTNSDCSCWDFEEHVHPFLPNDAAGADVRGYALTSAGDVWIGDRDLVSLYPSRTRGPRAGLDAIWSATLDVFPGVRDEVWGVGVDPHDGVWVASYGNGAAYLAPGTYVPTYYSRANKLPTNYLTGAAVDRNGDVWLATLNAGVVRYTPGADAWTYYTTGSGLPSNYIRNVYVDPYAATGRAVYFATDKGVAVYTGP